MDKTKSDADGKTAKRTFDKKKWREFKYNKKARVKRWEEKRKTVLKHKLNRQLRKEGQSFGVASISKDDELKTQKASSMQAARTAYELKKAEKAKARQDQLRKKKEISEALEKYRKKKRELACKLAKKTKKGQPLMKNRIELLFKKVQQAVDS